MSAEVILQGHRPSLYLDHSDGEGDVLCCCYLAEWQLDLECHSHSNSEGVGGDGEETLYAPIHSEGVRGDGEERSYPPIYFQTIFPPSSHQSLLFLCEWWFPMETIVRVHQSVHPCVSGGSLWGPRWEDSHMLTPV